MVLFFIALFHFTVNHRQVVRTGVKMPRTTISGSLRINVWQLAVCATCSDSVLNIEVPDLVIDKLND